MIGEGSRKGSFDEMTSFKRNFSFSAILGPSRVASNCVFFKALETGAICDFYDLAGPRVPWGPPGRVP